jgi:O-acetyl-ADP-ribose deacetylase (regulator of RNase III)
MADNHQATYVIGQSIFRVSYSDLTRSQSEVLISSDDNYLTMGGGVSMALSNACGPELAKHARKLVPLRQGDIAVTTAGRLPAKYVFHAVTIDFDTQQRPNAECIETLVKRCFDLAETLGIRSLTFPALGTGSGGFPFLEGADVMVRTIADRLASGHTVEEINLALWVRPGVTQGDLNVFYERAAGLASVAVQGKRVAYALKTLEDAVDGSNQPELKDAIRDILSSMRNANSTLRERPQEVKDVDRIESSSEVAEATRRVVELTGQQTSQWRDRTAAQKALQTRLEGLNTLLNVHFGSLNKMEIEKARYGGVGVPIILENQISDINDEIERVDRMIEETRRRLAEQTS